MSNTEPRAIAEKFYTALSELNLPAMMALHHDDVVFDIIGSTPVSGHFRGKDICFSQVFPPVIEALLPGKFDLAREWVIVCSDEDFAVGFNRGGGPTAEGSVYDQIYAMTFTVRGGLIVRLQGFFDTVHVEDVIFKNPLTEPRRPPACPFKLPEQPAPEPRFDDVLNIVTQYYDALTRSDMATYMALHDEEVVFNVNGSTPVSGRFVSRRSCFENVVEPFLSAFISEQSRFGIDRRIYAVDGQRAFAVMRGGGRTVQGVDADVFFAQLFTVRKGRIVELHQFLDTAHVEAAVFGNVSKDPGKPPDIPFQM